VNGNAARPFTLTMQTVKKMELSHIPSQFIQILLTTENNIGREILRQQMWNDLSNVNHSSRQKQIVRCSVSSEAPMPGEDWNHETNHQTPRATLKNWVKLVPH
jgi:hypothetical protein